MSALAPSIAINAPADPSDTRRRIFAIVGASSGNLVEWYDFYTYTFTSLYFAATFFPSGDRTSQLLATAGIFAAGNRARVVRTVDGKQSEIKVRLNKLLDSGDMTQNIELRPGDVLLIPQSRF